MRLIRLTKTIRLQCPEGLGTVELRFVVDGLLFLGSGVGF